MRCFLSNKSACEFQPLMGNHDDVTGGAVARTFLCDTYRSISLGRSL